MAEQYTPEEWRAYLSQLFAAEINGVKRPEESIPTDLQFSADLPQWIRMDPLRYDLLNAFWRQLLSNDKNLDTRLAGMLGNILAGKNIKIETDEDGKTIISVDGDLGINMIKRNQAYVVGDVVFVPQLPTWARLDCITAGTTGAAEPVWGEVTVEQQITDGTVVWIIHDVKNALYAP